MDEFEVFVCSSVGEFDVRCLLPTLPGFDSPVRNCGWVGHIGTNKNEAEEIFTTHKQNWAQYHGKKA